jgi:predicted nucleotidyltransferase
MPIQIQQLLKKFKKGLVQLYGSQLKGLYLYGSYARGDFDAGSDLDVLVVLNDFERAPLELKRTSQLVGDLSLEYLITISPVFMRERDWQLADKPLLRNVRVEGVAI